MASRYIVFGRTTCPYCVAATELLEERNKEMVFIDLSDDPQAITETKEFYNWPTVPIVLENDSDTGKVTFVGGYTDLSDKLDSE